ncbi:MAG: cytochrome c oxidase subunit II [Bacteroidetes bacterium]|nr:MAG: cytochrome c oxidase subunit II [Bacteroidota bacterium]
MDGTTLISVAQVFLGIILLLVSLNLYLILRLKEIDPFGSWNPNKINAGLFMVFLVGGLIAAYASTQAWSEHLIFFQPAVSEHGLEIDRMMRNTMGIALFVTVLTNILLFYYAWRYQAKPGRKALYYPHNNRLEVVWTVVPAVVLTLLVFDGVGVWHNIMDEAPEDSIQIEVNGKQFDWTVRYPGADMEYGETHVSFIDEISTNTLGFNFEDKRGHDDLVVREIHVPVNKDVNMTIRSRDVLHSATLAHFRVKMDAVPGMPTSFHFKPLVTTAEMRQRTGNPDFNYEMSCQQICGGGHWNMRLVVVVESEAEYNAWIAQQQPFYAQWQEMNGANNTAEAQPEGASSDAVAIASIATAQ